MGLAPILLVGPFVAVVGIVAVIFVMRHRSVQEKSMYSARRSQIERKVRAARQRTLAPTGRHSEKEAAPVDQAFTASGMEAKAAVPTATWGPTVRPEPQAPPPPPPPPPPSAPQTWEVGPTVPPPPPSTPPPEPPPYRPSAPPYAPPEPAYSPPEPAFTPAEPTYQAAPPDTTWTPAPPEPMAPSAEPQVTTPAGGGASWSIVGESKAATAQPEPEKKSKKDQDRTGSWQLASGEAPGEDEGEEIGRPSTTLAVAQYAVLVVGLVMVLIGVVVMLANSHVT